MGFEVMWEGTFGEFEKKFGEVRLSDEWERKEAERKDLERESNVILAERFKKNVLSGLDTDQKEMLQEVLSDCRGKMTGYRAYRILEHLRKIDRLSGKDLDVELKQVIEDERQICWEVNYLNGRLAGAISGVRPAQKKKLLKTLEGEPGLVREGMHQISHYYDATFRLPR